MSFLIFNFPPARMFMGDAGSAALGFLIAATAICEFGRAPDAFWLWVISLGGFIGDATATLVVRLLKGKKIYQAHRTHLYQLYTIKFEAMLKNVAEDSETARHRAHKRYLLMFCAIFFVWQIPCALLVATHTLSGIMGAVLCLSVLTIGAFVCGAGKSELSFPRGISDQAWIHNSHDSIHEETKPTEKNSLGNTPAQQLSRKYHPMPSDYLFFESHWQYRAATDGRSPLLS